MKLIRSLFLLLCISLPLMAQRYGCPEGASLKTMDLLAGENDFFKEPHDDTYLRPQVAQLYKGWQKFDEVKISGPQGHTFTDLPCMIVDATLIMRVRAINEEAMHDAFYLDYNEKDWRVRKLFEEVVEWRGETVEFEISLSELGLIDVMNEKGYLDFMVGFNTTVDYAMLRITYCDFTDCNNNCQPDETDIATGVSKDTNKNGIPDECEDLQGSNGEIVCPATVILIDRDDCCETTTLTATAINVEGDYTITNSIDPQQGASLTHCFPVGATTVYFTLNTYDGNPVTCTTTVIVQDKKGPSITPRLQ